MLNEKQQKIVEGRLIKFSEGLEEEVLRLMDSGGIAKDANGDYPLSTIFKVALENLAKQEYMGNRKQYYNLKKF